MKAIGSQIRHSATRQTHVSLRDTTFPQRRRCRNHTPPKDLRELRHSSVPQSRRQTNRLPRMKSCLEGKGVIEGARVLWRPRADGGGGDISSSSIWVTLEERKDRRTGNEVLFSERSLTQCENPACCLHTQDCDENASVFQADASVQGHRARHGKVKLNRESSQEWSVRSSASTWVAEEGMRMEVKCPNGGHCYYGDTNPSAESSRTFSR